MPKKIILIHRWAGNPDSDFYQWFANQMQSQGHEVVIPAMPETFTPKMDLWIPVVEKLLENADENTILIGHSIGCQTVLRSLQSLSKPVGGVVLVAPWFELKGLESEEEKTIARPWIETAIDFEKIKQIVQNITALFSEGDQFVEVQPNKMIVEQKLNAKTLVVDSSHGHFTEDEGITQLQLLVDVVSGFVGA